MGRSDYGPYRRFSAVGFGERRDNPWAEAWFRAREAQNASVARQGVGRRGGAARPPTRAWQAAAPGWGGSGGKKNSGQVEALATCGAAAERGGRVDQGAPRAGPSAHLGQVRRD